LAAARAVCGHERSILRLAAEPPETFPIFALRPVETAEEIDMPDVNISTLHPDLYKRLAGLSAQADAAVSAAGLDPLVGELVKIRVSQINGCAFCLRMHTRDALAKGETTDRLAVIAAWWESQYFAPTERAALALTEQVTLLNSDGRHQADEEVLTDQQASAIAWLTTVMNAWNRVAVTSHYPVAP
jgi:AhpD family alkylhydroperoxidase